MVMIITIILKIIIIRVCEALKLDLRPDITLGIGSDDCCSVTFLDGYPQSLFQKRKGTEVTGVGRDSASNLSADGNSRRTPGSQRFNRYRSEGKVPRGNQLGVFGLF